MRERQIAEFIEDDEVHTGQVIGEPTLARIAGFGFEPIDEIDECLGQYGGGDRTPNASTK